MHRARCWGGSLPQPLPKGKGFVAAMTEQAGTGKVCLMVWAGLNRVCSTVVQRLFNGCSMVVQWLFNGCSTVVQWQANNIAWKLNRHFLTLCLFDSLSLNVGFVYSLCIVQSTNYAFRNAREVRKMQGLCGDLCIVCIVFSFPFNLRIV